VRNVNIFTDQAIAFFLFQSYLKVNLMIKIKEIYAMQLAVELCCGMITQHLHLWYPDYSSLITSFKCTI